MGDMSKKNGYGGWFSEFDLRTGLRTIKIREKRKISDFSYLFNKPSFYEPFQVRSNTATMLLSN